MKVLSCYFWYKEENVWFEMLIQNIRGIINRLLALGCCWSFLYIGNLVVKNIRRISGCSDGKTTFPSALHLTLTFNTDLHKIIFSFSHNLCFGILVLHVIHLSCLDCRLFLCKRNISRWQNDSSFPLVSTLRYEGLHPWKPIWRTTLKTPVKANETITA